MKDKLEAPIMDKATWAMMTNLGLALTEAMKLAKVPPERMRQLENGDIAELYFWIKNENDEAAKTKPARYWSGVHMTENDVIEWAKSTGMGKEQPRLIIAALAHLRCLGHKITVLPECEAEPANEKLTHEAGAKDL